MSLKFAHPLKNAHQVLEQGALLLLLSSGRASEVTKSFESWRDSRKHVPKNTFRRTTDFKYDFTFHLFMFKRTNSIHSFKVNLASNGIEDFRLLPNYRTTTVQPYRIVIETLDVSCYLVVEDIGRTCLLEPKAITISIQIWAPWIVQLQCGPSLHITSNAEGRQRYLNGRSVIRCVIEEQQRQRMFLPKGYAGIEKFRTVCLKETHWARPMQWKLMLTTIEGNHGSTIWRKTLTTTTAVTII